MNVVANRQKRLAEAVEQAVRQAVAAGELPAAGDVQVQLEVPRERGHGDFATNFALAMAGEMKQAPRRIAEAAVKHLDHAAAGIERVEVAGPGFINFFLPADWLHDVLRAIRNDGLSYGNGTAGAGVAVQVEFVSANPTGPMNVVNARAAAVGDCLANLLAASGFRVEREYYVNDAGRQAELFGLSVDARYRQLQGEAAEIPEDGYPGDYVTDLARKFTAERPDLPDLSVEERTAYFETAGLDAVVEQQRQALQAFGVTYDCWFRERDLHAAGDVEAVVQALQQEGHCYEADGAVWLATSRFGDDKDRVLVRSDGKPTYLAADIAYHKHKYDRGFQRVIDIWGPDHHGHIARMHAGLQALAYASDALEILILQFVTLLRSGEQVKMSKRGGDFVTMDELVEEVGRDAARFFFLMRSPESPLDFDLELAKEETQDNPVYYVQYAHARICSIFRQAEAEGIGLPGQEPQLALLESAPEQELMRKLAFFPEEVELAALRREPHRIPRFAQELAQAFHGFYTQCRVLGEDAPVQAARLYLVACVRAVLARCLALVGVSAPESM